MSHILHLDASARAERSISRTLSHEFLTAWKDTHCRSKSVLKHSLPSMPTQERTRWMEAR
jgi:FMN-dependent NADH-azoreductase